MPAGGSRRLLFVNGAIVLVLLLAAGGTVYALTKSSSSSSSTLRTTPVGRGTVAETVTAAGSVTTAASATLNFGVSGRIAEIRVRLGDQVHTGQTLARLDGEYAQANLRAADAQVSADEQALEDAEYQKDHPQSATGTSTSSTASTMSTTGTSTSSTASTMSTTGTGSTSTTRTSNLRDSTSRNAIEDVNPPGGGPGVGAPPARSSTSTLGPFFGPAAAATTTTSAAPPPVAPPPMTTPVAKAPGATSTMGTSTMGSSPATTTAKTSADPGEAAVRNAQAKLDQDRAARIQAFQATQNLDLVSPEDGTVVSLDGLVGQVAGPQGIVLNSTATGNPAGGRLPDGSAISSGAGSGQSATTGSSTASAAGGAAGGAGGAASAGSAGASVTAAPAAPAVMTIANLVAMQVLAQVPELDVGKVANGQPVAVSVNALQGQKIPGSVTSINLLPGSQATVQYGTAVLMAAPPPGLRPGMSASVSITTRQANDVTFLPSVAVTPVGGPDSGQATVQVLQPDGSTAPRTIGTGLASDTVTQVTSGLSLGDLVVLPDQSAASAATLRGLNRGGGGGGGAGGGGGR